jgi:hypothetical protein
MNICGKVKEIINSNNIAEFKSLIDFLKFTNCKTEAEIRSMFFACGMSPERYDSLRYKLKSR